MPTRLGITCKLPGCYQLSEINKSSVHICSLRLQGTCRFFKTISAILVYKSTIQLLRIPFSFFLMPVYWFALSFAEHIDIAKAVLLFFIIHMLVYPSSTGYTSYMDRDTTSIGGLEKPLQPTNQLFVFTVIMDV